MKNKTHNLKEKNGGYTLLFAVIVSTLVLSIGVSILSISKKELLLATSTRDSAMAFYAADSGVECAAYGDRKYNSFSTSTADLPTKPLDCGTMGAMSPAVGAAATEVSTGVYERSFSVKFGSTGGSCATVTVRRQYVNGSLDTTIDSRGYNLGWNDQARTCDVQSPKKVERGLRLTY